MNKFEKRTYIESWIPGPEYYVKILILQKLRGNWQVPSQFWNKKIYLENHILIYFITFGVIKKIQQNFILCFFIPLLTNISFFIAILLNRLFQANYKDKNWKF